MPNLKGAVENLRRQLRVLKFNHNVNFQGMILGHSDAFVSFYRYLLCDYDAKLTSQLLEREFVLYGSSNNRFMEIVYKILRDVFNFRPSITIGQFFANGFAERKIEMATHIASRIATFLGSKHSTSASSLMASKRINKICQNSSRMTRSAATKRLFSLSANGCDIVGRTDQPTKENAHLPSHLVVRGVCDGAQHQSSNGDLNGEVPKIHWFPNGSVDVACSGNSTRVGSNQATKRGLLGSRSVGDNGHASHYRSSSLGRPSGCDLGSNRPLVQSMSTTATSNRQASSHDDYRHLAKNSSSSSNNELLSKTHSMDYDKIMSSLSQLTGRVDSMLNRMNKLELRLSNVETVMPNENTTHGLLANENVVKWKSNNVDSNYQSYPTYTKSELAQTAPKSSIYANASLKKCHHLSDLNSRTLSVDVVKMAPVRSEAFAGLGDSLRDPLSNARSGEHNRYNATFDHAMPLKDIQTKLNYDVHKAHPSINVNVKDSNVDFYYSKHLDKTATSSSFERTLASTQQSLLTRTSTNDAHEFGACEAFRKPLFNSMTSSHNSNPTAIHTSSAGRSNGMVGQKSADLVGRRRPAVSWYANDDGDEDKRDLANAVDNEYDVDENSYQAQVERITNMLTETQNLFINDPETMVQKDTSVDYPTNDIGLLVT